MERSNSSPIPVWAGSPAAHLAALLAGLLAMLLWAPPAPVSARVAPGVGAPALCIEAAREAAERHGVPVNVMLAITLVETRRTVNGVSGPWPWTLNIEGKGYWYETRSEALSHAERVLAQGRRLIDLGCFQLNFRWHGGNFATADQMLEPALSADYAARFLSGLHAETGDWIRAAGLYHSRTPLHSRRYRGLVGRALARLGAGPGRMAALDTSGAAPDEAPHPGPRMPPPAGAAVPADDPMRTAAPGAVMLRIFATQARPLFAAPGLNP